MINIFGLDKNNKYVLVLFLIGVVHLDSVDCSFDRPIIPQTEQKCTSSQTQLHPIKRKNFINA